MKWVPLTNYENGMNFDDRPRRLTQEEIAYIIAHFPTAPSADSTSAEIARNSIVEWMVETLRDIEIAPSAIPDLIQNIIHQHNKSLVVPGTPIGITAAEAVGATNTQMTLNSVAPWERIIIQDINGDSHLVEIGKWIDGLILYDSSNIKYIPENRTQYLELQNPVSIATPNKNGTVTWDKITAVTKHLPVGDMVKVVTRSGREVTATQSKSLLVWNGTELEQREGSSVKVGDLIPILNMIPEPPIVINYHKGIKLTKSIGKRFGYYILNQENNDSELSDWVIDGLPSVNILFANKDFLKGLLMSKDFTEAGGIISEYRDYIERRIGLKGCDIGNIMLDPIVSVEYVPASEYVYDLTVPTTTNFSLWNGMGVADTFHTSGSAKSASFGIEAMRDLIFARKNPKNESSTIYFTNKNATYEEVLDSRSYIVGSMVKDFIIDYDIDSPAVLQQYWWHNTTQILLQKELPPSTKVLRLFLNVPEMFKHKITISELANVLEREVPRSAVSIYGPIADGIIDLYPYPDIINETLKGKEKSGIPLDLAEMTYLESIVVPELANIRVKGIPGIKQLYPLVSPVWRVVLLERKLAQQDLTNPALQNLYERFLGNAWMLFYNLDIMRTTGINPENLAALCQFAGLEIVGGTDDRLIINMPNDRFRTSDGEVIYKINDRMVRKLSTEKILTYEDVRYKEVQEDNFRQTESEWIEKLDNNLVIILPENYVRRIDGLLYKQLNPDKLLIIGDDWYEDIIEDDGKSPRVEEVKPSEYVNAKVVIDKRANKQRTEELTRINIESAKDLPLNKKKILIEKPVIVPKTNLMKAAEFVIAETDGSNLKELLALPGIDKKRTTCNNMYMICETLGIEAARTFLLRSLTNTIANTGSYVHPANIIFIAEFITSRGEPYGATYTGISRQPGGHLSLATVERAGEVFTKSALHGRKEDIRNVSASVAVGTRMAIGTGAFDIAQDIIVNGQTHTVINDDLFTALENDDITKNILAEYQQNINITVDDLSQGIEDLKGLTVGNANYDYSGADDQVNLLLINQADVEPITTRTTQATVPHKVVRRIQQQTIPKDMVDVLSQIKIGVPLPENLVITPLETGIIIKQHSPVPVISTGLVPVMELNRTIVDTGLPDELDDLFNQYLPPIGENIIIVEELPTVEIPKLPNLSGFNSSRDQIEIRREQVRDLQPVDTSNLRGIFENK